MSSQYSIHYNPLSPVCVFWEVVRHIPFTSLPINLAGDAGPGRRAGTEAAVALQTSQDPPRGEGFPSRWRIVILKRPNDSVQTIQGWKLPGNSDNRCDKSENTERG